MSALKELYTIHLDDGKVLQCKNIPIIVDVVEEKAFEVTKALSEVIESGKNYSIEYEAFGAEETMIKILDHRETVKTISVEKSMQNEVLDRTIFILNVYCADKNRKGAVEIMNKPKFFNKYGLAAADIEKVIYEIQRVRYETDRIWGEKNKEATDNIKQLTYDAMNRLEIPYRLLRRAAEDVGDEDDI